MILTAVNSQCDDSWGGSGGHAKGDVKVLGVFGEDETLCRRASLECQGVKFCEFFDRDLLEHFERFEADPTVMQDLWKKMLDRNEADVREPEGIIAR